MGMNMNLFSLPLNFCVILLVLFSAVTAMWTPGTQNANVLVLQILLDPAGFIKYNQMCALFIPLLFFRG